MKAPRSRAIAKVLFWTGLAFGIPIWSRSFYDALRAPYGLDGVLSGIQEIFVITSAEKAFHLWLGMASIPALLVSVGGVLLLIERRRLKGSTAASPVS